MTGAIKRLVNHNEIADQLVSMSEGRLRKKQLKGYMVLETTSSKSQRDKNAVSFLREGVSFMIPDDGFIGLALSTGLEAEKSKSFPRLLLKNLDMTQVMENTEFFSRILDEAIRDSQRRQSKR